MGLNINDIDVALSNVTLEDQTVSTNSEYVVKRIPVGKHPVRLVSYIELGTHAQSAYQGVERKPAEMVTLTFEFLGKATTEIVDGKVTSAIRKSVTIKKSFHEKSAFRKLFEKMREGDSTIKNMSSMVGRKSWMMQVEWSQNNVILTNAKAVADAEAKAKEAPQDKTLTIWDNIRNSEGFMISPAVRPIIDEDTGEQTGTSPVKVRPVFGPLAMFLWQQPKPNFWDSIFIDGSYETGEGDKKVTVSKNRLQNKCLEALDFEGSPLQDMLDGLSKVVADTTPEPETKTVDEDDDHGASAIDELFD